MVLSILYFLFFSFFWGVGGGAELTVVLNPSLSHFQVVMTCLQSDKT